MNAEVQVKSRGLSQMLCRAKIDLLLLGLALKLQPHVHHRFCSAQSNYDEFRFHDHFLNLTPTPFRVFIL